MTEQNAWRGVRMMLAALIVFAAQDGITRHLTVLYPVQMVVLRFCRTSCAGHHVLIRACDLAGASAIQPVPDLRLVFIAGLGFFLFHQTLRISVIFGSAIVIAAGLFTLWRQRITGRG